MTLRLALPAMAFLALATPRAQAQLAEVMICDEIDELVYRCSDLNGDGDFLDANEASLLFDAGALNGFNPYSIEVRKEGGLPTFYLCLDFPDVVYRGQDVDGDGVVSGDEVTFFFNIAATYGGGGDPHGITLTEDGAVWLSSSFEVNEGLWRLEDLNGDGDAMDAGEFAYMVLGSAPHPVETDAGVVLTELDDLRYLARDGNGVIGYSGFSSTGTDENSLFRFEDLNGDGDVLDAGESRLLLNYTGFNPALPVNPDFGTSLPTMEVSGGGYGRLWHVETLVVGGTTQYFFGCDSSATGGFGVSTTGDAIHGYVFQGIDQNGDGDVNDAGEVTLFYDGSSDGALPSALHIEKLVGMGAEGQHLYLADITGQRISRVSDLNGDRSIDASEVEADLWSFAQWGVNPPFEGPAGPFISDIEAGPSGLFPPATGNWSTEGVACSAFSPGPPQVGREGCANLGTSNFALQVSGTGAFLPAVAAFGFSDTDFGGIPLPLDLTTFGYPGCSLYQNLKGDLATSTDASGFASQPIPIPDDGTLVGLPVHLQWLILDLAGSGGIALSDKGTVIIEA